MCVESWGPDSDHRPSVQSVLLGLCPESKAQGHLWLGRSGEGGWCLLSVLVVWLLRTCGWSCHWRSEMKKMKFSCLSDIVRLLRGTELQPAASRFSIWLAHRLRCGPCSWDLLCKGLRFPEYLPGALPMVSGVPDLDARFPRGVVDPVGWDWGWVPRGLLLKGRSSCNFFFCEKNLRLNSEGGFDYRELVGALSCWMISILIGAIWVLFFYFHVWKVFSPNERSLASWLGLGILQRLMEATLGFSFCLKFFGSKCLANALWQRLQRIY